MNTRLKEIIKYKAGGRQTVFAKMLGWSPQYLTKLCNGEGIGLKSIMKILSTFPEIDARWLLTNRGRMFV